MKMELDIAVKKNKDLTEQELEDIVTLCSHAFNENFRPYMKSFINATHILGYYNGALVSHVLWLNRWTRAGDSPIMKTAFVDAVAVDGKYRKRGFASSMIARLTSEITAYNVSALTTGSPEFYERLGWQAWQGPVYFQREDGEITELNDSKLMVLFLPRTLALELNEPLTIEWRE